MKEPLLFTAKTVEDALAAALKEMNVTREQVNYEILERPSNGFLGLIGKKPAKIRVTLKEEQPALKEVEELPDTSKIEQKEEAVPRDSLPLKSEAETEGEDYAGGDLSSIESNGCKPTKRGEEFLQNVFSAMSLSVQIEKTEGDSTATFHLSGERLGILIGKHGQTLDALQYLTNIVANKGAGDNRVRMVIDVEDYRERREETLQQLAQHLADKACRLHEEVNLEPMNRHERKIIHTALQNNRRVSTYSAGEEPYRHVVISPKRSRRAFHEREEEKHDEGEQ